MNLQQKLGTFGNILGGTSNANTFLPGEILLGSPALGAVDAVVLETALTGSAQPGLTAGITQPDVARNVTVTGNAGGNAGNVTVHGTDEEGVVISETIALSGTSTVAGTKAFKTITSYDLPAQTHSGTDTVKIGLGAKLGIGIRLKRDTVSAAYLNNVKEATVAPIVAIDATTLALNTVTLDSALNGTPVVIALSVPAGMF